LEKKDKADAAKAEAPVDAPAEIAASTLSQVAGDDYENTDKRIGEHGYDPWVYKFSYDAMPPIAGWKSEGSVGAKYGWHPSNQHPNPPAHGSYGSDTVNPPAALAQHRHKHRHHHKHQHKTRDIGDNGIDEAVHGFASADKSVLPQPWRRV
jgi:hypothetical protein